MNNLLNTGVRNEEGRNLDIRNGGIDEPIDYSAVGKSIDQNVGSNKAGNGNGDGYCGILHNYRKHKRYCESEDYGGYTGDHLW